MTTALSKPKTLSHPKTRADLEWDRVLSALVARCRTAMGKALASDLPLLAENDACRRALDEAKEATDLERLGEPLPVGELGDAADALDRLRAHGVLSASEMGACIKLLETARGLRRHLQTRRSRSPRLFDTCATDPDLDRVLGELAPCFDADGTLADRASPRLAELRAEYKHARQRLLARLDDLMRKYASIVQEHYVTEREGRYVIPIRSDAHERFPGLVHASSASGSTLFVEPRAVIPMGNRLKMLEAEVAREEAVIFTALSATLQEVLPSLHAAYEAIAVADVRAATARLGRELLLEFPRVVDAPELDLRDARHPLLLLDLPAVVPSDLRVRGGHAMVISGPNAGGKTVALKTMGLVALMTRAGLPVPCAPESTVGLFDTVLTDVGDDQNLQKNLSTFSAHVKNLVTILQETHPGALVLLDELAGGTDPREGEALAAGVLDSLCARGGAVVLTTHYEGLKALALSDDRFENASVGFDVERLAPTYEVLLGVPGSSSALAVARQYGMPSTVLERAKGFLAHDERSFEETVQRLNDERRAATLARAAAEGHAEEVRVLRDELAQEVERARQRERSQLSEEAQAVRTRLLRAKEELRGAMRRLRVKHADAPTLKEVARSLDRVAGDFAIGGPLEGLLTTETAVAPDAPLGQGALRKGLSVYVPRLRADAEVVDVVGDDQVRIAAGGLKMIVTAGELRAARAAGRTPSSPSTASGRTATPTRGTGSAVGASAAGLEVPMQTSDNTVDVRGLRPDDALAMAMAFLDRAYGEGRRTAFVIHGLGTGSLRDVLRRELRNCHYVRALRPGEPREGGDGVTVLWLT